MRKIFYPSLALLLALGGCTGSSGAIDAPASADAPPANDASSPDRDAALDGPPIADGAVTDGPISDPMAVEETFRVLHWNIAGGKENDCKAPGITAAVLTFVRDRNIDFVGLNELCPAQYDSIRDALGTYWGKREGAQFSAFVGDKTGRIVGNGIFSRFNIRGVTREQVGSDQYGNRNLICAEVTRYPHLRFCSIHLTPGDATARVQIGRVLSSIEALWKNGRDTVLLAGDLNLHPNDPGLNSVYSPAANNPKNNPNNQGHYREVDDADADHCPGYGERSTPGTTGGPCQAGGKIDFIFVRENRIVDGHYFGDTLNIPATCTGVCSDHRPVIGQATVRIRMD